MDKLNVIISNSHVNNKSLLNDISILNFIQDIEGIHINSLKEFNNYLENNNLGVFLTYREINIIKRPKLFDEIIITTYPFNTRSISGYRHIYLKDTNGNNLITSTAFGVFVDLDTYLVKRLPKEIIKTIKDKKQDQNIDLTNRKISYDENLDDVFINKVVAKSSFIDRYDHVNNSQYVKLAYDSLDLEFKYNKIRTEYIKSFKYNDEIYVYLKEKSENKRLFLLKDNKNVVYSIVEFTNNLKNN